MAVAPETPPPEPQPRKRSLRRRVVRILLGLVAAVIVFIVGVVVLVGSATKDARKVSDRFVTAVQHDDGAAAYGLTSRDFRKASAEPAVQQLIDRLSKLTTAKRSIISRSIHASTAYGKIAVFVYRMPTRQGVPIYFKTQVKKEGSRWRIQNFRSSAKKLADKVE